MLSLRFQVTYLAATSLVFVCVALLSRAGPRRIAGALCAVVAFTLVSAPIDTFAAEHGWWTYPACTDPPHPALALYLGQALLFVGCIALVGWRVQRRFGLRGLARLAVAVCVVGFVRDFSVAAVLPEMIRFGEQPAAALADLGAWTVVVAFALAIPRLVAGRADADTLRGA